MDVQLILNEKYDDIFKNDNIKPNYLLAMPCIINKNLFLKNLEISYNKKKYKKNLPFNFERSFAENEILPFRCSLLKKELFASIDDDKDIPNSSLIGRGLYKERENSTKKVPIIVASGKNEKADKTVSLRRIGSNESKVMDLDKAVQEIAKENTI